MQQYANHPSSGPVMLDTPSYFRNSECRHSERIIFGRLGGLAVKPSLLDLTGPPGLSWKAIGRAVPTDRQIAVHIRRDAASIRQAVGQGTTP